MRIRIKRVYDPPAEDDGFRVLVDRLWPRGMRRDALAIDAWWRQLTPSDGLRRWFHADPERWPDFCERYRAELEALPPEAAEPALRDAAAAREKGRLTLLTAARQPGRSHVPVLREWLAERLGVGVDESSGRDGE